MYQKRQPVFVSVLTLILFWFQALIPLILQWQHKIEKKQYFLLSDYRWSYTHFTFLGVIYSSRSDTTTNRHSADDFSMSDEKTKAWLKARSSSACWYHRFQYPFPVTQELSIRRALKKLQTCYIMVGISFHIIPPERNTKVGRHLVNFLPPVYGRPY